MAQPSTRPGPSQYEKFDQIVNWLLTQSDGPVKEISSIIDRLTRNFRIPNNSVQDEGERASPLLRFIARCERLARQLNKVVRRVITVEGDPSAFALPEAPVKKAGDEKEKLEQVLQNVVAQLDYIFNFMEDDIELLYMFCDMVQPAEQKKSPPESAAKKVLFVVERAKRVVSNLKRLQSFVLIKHNVPEPGLVEDLIALQQLRVYGYITEEEYVFREVSVIENIVRAYVTRGRFLEQKEQQRAVAGPAPAPVSGPASGPAPAPTPVKKEKPVEVPAGVPEHLKAPFAKLKMLLDGDFIEVAEYNHRVSQLVTKWQEEKDKEKQRVEEKDRRSKVLTSDPAEKRWEKQSSADASGAAAAPPPVPDFGGPPPVPAFDIASPRNNNTSPRTAQPAPVKEENVDSRWEAPAVAADSLSASGTLRPNKPLPDPIAMQQRQQQQAAASATASGSPSSAFSPLSASAASTSSSAPSSPITSTPVVKVGAARDNDPDAAMAKLSAALAAQAQAKNAQAQAQQQAQAQALSKSGVSTPQRTVSPLTVQKSPMIDRIDKGKKRTSVFQRIGSPTTATSGSLSLSSSPEGLGSSFDDLAALQLGAKMRNDPEAYRLHMVEKKVGKDVIQLKACIDKTYVAEGHSVTVKLFISNQTKKSVNCVKFILQTHATEEVLHTVEDATRDVQSGEEPQFPLIKSAWSGKINYMLPVNTSPGFYKLRVQLFYNTRYNIDVPIALHVLTKEALWQHNPQQVFGVPLDEVLKREGSQIPYAVSKTIEALSSESCLKVEGIFRLSGDLTKILQVRDEMDSGKRPVFTKYLGTEQGMQGAHLVAGVLKLFLRLLPHPLFGESQYDDLLNAHQKVKNAPAEAKIAEYKPIVARIPESARVLMATLSDFFNLFIIPHSELNKMAHANLAIVFGPVFVWRANLSPMEELANASKVNGLVKEMFELAPQLFPEVYPIPGVSSGASGGGGAANGSVAPIAKGEVPVKRNVSSSNVGTSRPLMGTGRKDFSSPMVDRKGLSVSTPALNVSGPIANVGTPDSVRRSKPLPPLPRSALNTNNNDGGNNSTSEGEDDTL